MADDQDQNELEQDLQKGLRNVYKKRLEAMEEVWAIVKAVEEEARTEITMSKTRAMRKLHLIEKIQKQLQSIQKLISDLPPDR